MSIKELEAKVHELKELQRLAEELDAEISAAEDALKAEMTARDTDTLAGTDWRITWKLVRGTRFDSVAFKKANPEAYALFAKATESRRFCLV